MALDMLTADQYIYYLRGKLQRYQLEELRRSYQELQDLLKAIEAEKIEVHVDVPVETKPPTVELIRLEDAKDFDRPLFVPKNMETKPCEHTIDGKPCDVPCCVHCESHFDECECEVENEPSDN